MKFKLNIAHLYGDLLNIYGDNGNLLALSYYAKQMDIDLYTEVVSLNDEFDPNKWDIVMFGGGQDYEQSIVSKDLQSKKAALTEYIENDGSMLAICGGYQLLGHYYISADGEKIPGLGALDHYTLSQDNNRFTGDILIKNPENGDTYHGFENHNGMTFLGKGEKPLGVVEEGQGNNGQDKSEGVIYKNVYGSYFHGPILTRNGNLAKTILLNALKKKYPDADLSEQENFNVQPSY